MMGDFGTTGGWPPRCRQRPSAWLGCTTPWSGPRSRRRAWSPLASAQERAALRLLTHRDVAEERDDATFLSHVRIIAATPGAAGRIARAVKRADMEDRMRMPRDPGAAWQPPYREALDLLAREGGLTSGASLPTAPNDPEGTPR